MSLIITNFNSLKISSKLTDRRISTSIVLVDMKKKSADIFNKEELAQLENVTTFLKIFTGCKVSFDLFRNVN